MKFIAVALFLSLSAVAFSATTVTDGASEQELSTITAPVSGGEVDLAPADRSLKCVKSFYCSYCPYGYFYGNYCHLYRYLWQPYDWCYGKDYCICKRCFAHHKFLPFHKGPPKFKIPRKKFPKFPKRKFPKKIFH